MVEGQLSGVRGAVLIAYLIKNLSYLQIYYRRLSHCRMAWASTRTSSFLANNISSTFCSSHWLFNFRHQISCRSFRWPKSSNETWIGRAENWTVSALTLAYTQFADIYSEQFYMALLAATQAKMNRRNPTIDHPTANKQKKPINHRQSIAPTENVTT